MTPNKISGRFLVKKSYIYGIVPTIPSTQFHTDGRWLDTDIYQGELYINMVDNKFWFRNGKDQLIEVPLVNNNTGKIDDRHLPDMYGKLNYMGIWDTTLNNPILEPKIGDYLLVSVGTDIYSVGDMVIYNGEKWDIIKYNNIVFSENIVFNKNGYSTLDDVIQYLLDITNKTNNISIGNISLKNDEYNLTITNNTSSFVIGDVLKFNDNVVYHSGNINDVDFDFTKMDLITNTITTNGIKTNDLISNELLLNNGKICLTDKTIYIEGNGKGFVFNHINDTIIKYTCSNNNILSFYKLSYNTSKDIVNDNDIVHKKYVDDKSDKTENILISKSDQNQHIINKGVRNINVDISSPIEYINVDVTKLIQTSNSFNLTICITNDNNLFFNLNVLSNGEVISNINKQGIVYLYYNSLKNIWILK
jgi:hypothetical protein